jgi:hypothetical protein
MPSNKRPAPVQRKPSDSRTVTSEDIATHLDAFAAAGGKVEVLGVTRVLKHIDEATVSATSPPLPRR